MKYIGHRLKIFQYEIHEMRIKISTSKNYYHFRWMSVAETSILSLNWKEEVHTLATSEWFEE